MCKKRKIILQTEKQAFQKKEALKQKREKMSRRSFQRRLLQQQRKQQVIQRVGQKPEPDIAQSFLPARLQALQEIIRNTGMEFQGKRFPKKGKRTLEDIFQHVVFRLFRPDRTSAGVLRFKASPRTSGSISKEEFVRRSLFIAAHHINLRLEAERIGKISENRRDFDAFLRKYVPQLLEAERVRLQKSTTAYETDPRFRVGILLMVHGLKPPVENIQSELAEAQNELAFFEGCKLLTEEMQIPLRPVHATFLASTTQFYLDLRRLLQQLPLMPINQRKKLQEYAQKIEALDREHQ
jgi:hypothetical protein